jgi:hypothetical protein
MQDQTTAPEIQIDRRWEWCAGVHCSGLSVPSAELLRSIELDMEADNRSVFAADHDFLRRIVTDITGPPGFVVRVTEEPKTPVEFYEFRVIQPMPDSEDPTKTFNVARNAFSLGAAKRDRDLILKDVNAATEALALHEVKEWLRYGGVHIRSPHEGVEAILS